MGTHGGHEQVVVPSFEEGVGHAQARVVVHRYFFSFDYVAGQAARLGRVLNLSFATVGGVIPPSEPIMQIVPEDDDLVVEARLRTIDRDSVRKGADVNARFTAFPTRGTPELIGQVESISADVITDPNNGEPYYNLRVTFTAGEYQRLEEALARQAADTSRDLKLIPGMPVDIFVDNGEPRRPIEIFFEPLEEVIDKALRGS